VARLYRIVSAEEWRALERDGEFRGAAHDVRDGFVHLSAAHQVAVTLSAHYPGRPGLLLLAVDADALGSSSGAAVKWEVSRGGALFPHLYGALSASAVVAADTARAGRERRARAPAVRMTFGIIVVSSQATARRPTSRDALRRRRHPLGQLASAHV
jgi:uncharacterized protein (DUF952 family)